MAIAVALNMANSSRTLVAVNTLVCGAPDEVTAPRLVKQTVEWNTSGDTHDSLSQPPYQYSRLESNWGHRRRVPDSDGCSKEPLTVVVLVVQERNEMDAEGVNCDLEREGRRKVQWEVAVTFGTDGESRGGVV
jgi:hypothetical protein